jgi:hypothetical protein
MAPLFTTTRNSSQYAKLAEEKAGPLFYGIHCITKGVVGLAISSEGIAVKILPHQCFMVFLHIVSSLLQSVMEISVFDQIPNEEEMQSVCWQAWLGQTSVAPTMFLRTTGGCFLGLCHVMAL